MPKYRIWPIEWLENEHFVKEMEELNWEIYGYSEFNSAGQPKYVEWIHR